MFADGETIDNLGLLLLFAEERLYGLLLLLAVGETFTFDLVLDFGLAVVVDAVECGVVEIHLRAVVLFVRI